MAEKTTSDLCRKARELMFEYADETLGEKDAAWLEMHITSCPDCAAELAKCRETLKLIKASRYDAPFSIADAVMNTIGKESVKSPLASAFTGFFRKKNFARYGTIAAAVLLVAVVAINHDAIFRMTRGLTASQEAADVAEVNFSMAEDADAYSYTAEGSAVMTVDETVRYVETVASMMMTSPTSSGMGSAENEAASEEEKSTDKSYAGSNEPVSDVTEAPAFMAPAKNQPETRPETGAAVADTEAETVHEIMTDADDAPAVDAAPRGEEQSDDRIYRDVETSEDYPEENITFYYDLPLESYGNIVAYLNVSDVRAAMSVLGLTEYLTVDNNDGSESIMCSYNMDELDDIIDYLRLTNINYAVHYTGNDILENGTDYVVINEIK